MVYREVHRMELRELLRRWQAGQSIRMIARTTGLARNTVGKYISAAEALGLTISGPPASDDQLARLLAQGYTGYPHRSPGPSESLLAPHREQIGLWITKDRYRLTRIHELLADKGCVVPYTSLRHFVAKEQLGARAATTVRMAPTAPSQYAEMDFGRLGFHHDPTTGRRQVVYALLVVLSYSRHMFVWPMLRQHLEEVTLGLEAAWHFFSGVPHHLVLDNFPAAVAEPDSLSPRLTRGFLDYAQFRGFLPDPARVRHPKDKPHVEREVPYVRDRFFAGASFLDLADTRSGAGRWCKEVAGSRLHGTTHRGPFQVFLEEEQSCLLPLKPGPYLIPQYATLKVHDGHHVEFSSALYSVPYDLCPPGSDLEVRGNRELVRFYLRGNLVKTHPRQPKADAPLTPPITHRTRSPTPAGLPSNCAARPRSLGPASASSLEGSWPTSRRGPGYVRPANCSVWPTATPRLAWRLPAQEPSPTTWSTSIAWSASWSVPWTSKSRRRQPRPRRDSFTSPTCRHLPGSPDQAAPSPERPPRPPAPRPQEVTDHAYP